jgi:hypothetical protein
MGPLCQRLEKTHKQLEKMIWKRWKNSKYYTGDDNEGYEECLAVLNNHELSAEERYDQLME